jgi:hypothetical protein
MGFSLPRNAHLWFPGVLSSEIGRLRRNVEHEGPTDVLFCVADHYEPNFGNPGLEVERRRVAAWVERYPAMASEFTDSNGRPPQHTFFYPEEDYKAELLDQLALLCHRGFGDVEVHMHHDNDTASAMTDRVGRFIEALANRHGLLRRGADGHIAFGFIHGNWALDNSRPDGRWCGVNNELTVLRRLGCYADFTLPSAPDASQIRTVNAIYYATDDPNRPRSHEYGTPVRVGGQAPPESLLMIQGPLTLNWRRRIFGLLPGLENGMLDASRAHHPTLERFRSWVNVGVSVEGRPEWVFVKVHSHGAREDNAEILLGETGRRFHAALGRAFNDGRQYRLHYVTAFEMAMLAKAAEAGHSGHPGQYLKSSFI